MIASIAPVLERIAAIESRFASSQSPLIVSSPSSPSPEFAGVISGFQGGEPAAASTPGAVGAGAVATPLARPTLSGVEFAGQARVVAADTLGVARSLDPVPGTGSSLAGVPYAEHFAAAGARHGVPPELLAAVGWVESRYQPNAVSPAGAEGLMQLMPFVSAELGVDPYDPASAIDGAARILAAHHRRFGSWELAIAAYHAGAGAVARAGGPPGPRTATYVERVLQRMENR